MRTALGLLTGTLLGMAIWMAAFSGAPLPPAHADPPAPDLNPPWSSSIRVNDDTGYASQYNPVTAVDGAGNVYALWYDYRNALTVSSNSDIYFSKLPAGTSTWGPNMKVNDDTGTASQSNPSLAVDASGNAYAVWRDQRNGTYDIYFASLPAGGSGWSTNLKVNDNSSSNRYSPAIAVDGSGTAYAVWYDSRVGNYDIYVAKLPSGTSTWSANARLNDDTGTADQGGPMIAADSAGNVQAVWHDYRNGNYGIYSAKLPAGATNWGTNVKVSDDTGTAIQRYPSVAIDGAGRAYAVWEEYRANPNGDIYFASLGAGETGWSASTKVNDDSGTTGHGYPSITSDGSGNLYVVWEDYGSGTHIYFAKRATGSSTWNSRIRVDDNSSAYRPRIVADSVGNAYVLWYGYRSYCCYTDISASKLAAEAILPTATPTSTPPPPTNTPTPTNTPVPPTVQISPPSRSVVQGQVVTAAVRILSARDMGAASVVFHFDPSVVRVTDVLGNPVSALYPSTGQCYSHIGSAIWAASVDNTTGVVTYSESTITDPYVTGNCTLTSMYLRGVGVGSATLSLGPVDLWDSWGNSIAAVIQNGTIDVASATPTATFTSSPTRTSTPTQTPTPTITPTPYPTPPGGSAIQGVVSVLPGRPDQSGVLVDLAGTAALSTTTAGDGSFTVTSLSPGAYTVTLSYPSALMARKASVPVTTGQTTVLPGAVLYAGDLKVDANNRVDLFDLILMGSNWNRTSPTAWTGTITTAASGLVDASVRGRVSAVSGRSDRSGVAVCVGPFVRSAGLEQCSGSMVVAGSDGFYGLDGLSAGAITVTAYLPGYLYTQRADLVLTAGVTSYLPDVSLFPGDLKVDGGNRVDLFDLILLGSNWQRTAPTPW